MPIIKEEPLTKYDPATFAFNSCKNEVAEAMHSDWKYDKVDDAKKRAIYDAKNYDEFKDRVAGCTLKPIHRNEFNAPPKFAFNRSADYGGDKAVGSSAGVKSQVTIPQRGGVVIKTSREFDRELRRCSSSEGKVALLQRLDEDDLSRLFARELDAEVLRQLILALDETLGTEAAPAGSAFRFLSALATNCPTSASTAAAFLINAERAAVARLLALEGRGQGAERAAENVRICAALGVQPQMLDAAVVEAEASPLPEPQGQPAEGAAPGQGAQAGGGRADDSGAAGVGAASPPKEPEESPEARALLASTKEVADVGSCDTLD